MPGTHRVLRNKIDELHGLIRWDCVYRESSHICLTEIWLQQDKDPVSAYVLDSFTLVHVDRTLDSGKTAGGGVCVYVNIKWCTDITAYEHMYSC